VNRRTAILVAVVLGVVAVILLRKYVTDLRQSYFKETVEVAVANANLPEGTVLTEDIVSYRSDWPADLLPSGAIGPNSIDMFYGHQLLAPLVQGDLLLAGYLVRPRPVFPLAELLTEGERAITLACDEIAGVAGMIRPNDRIDILGTFEVTAQEMGETPDPGDTAAGMGAGFGQRSFTYTLLQDVKVLAVDDRRADESPSQTKKAEETYNSITVALTPGEARMVVFALEKGRLNYALRPKEDMLIEDAEEDLEVVDVRNLFAHLVRETKTRKERRIVEVRPK